MNFHPEILSGEAQKTFSSLKNFPLIRKFYLGGGTGLALQIGHRTSADLDFFIDGDFDEAALIQELKDQGEFQLEKKAENTAIGILNGVKISFLGYKYPLLEKIEELEAIKIASIMDIACMKVDAIASRGTKRDFVDVYFAAREKFSLKEILDNFEKKYVSLNYNLIHVKKSLVYFEDAEADPMPIMLKPAKWTEIKIFFEQEVLKLIKINTAD